MGEEGEGLLPPEYDGEGFVFDLEGVVDDGDLGVRFVELLGGVVFGGVATLRRGGSDVLTEEVVSTPLLLRERDTICFLPAAIL